MRSLSPLLFCMYTSVVLGWWIVVMATTGVANGRVSVVMCMLSLVGAAELDIVLPPGAVGLVRLSVLGGSTCM